MKIKVNSVLIIIIAVFLCIIFSGCGLKAISEDVNPESSPEAIVETPAPIIEPLKVELMASDGESLVITEDDTEVTLTRTDYFVPLAENAGVLKSLSKIDIADGLVFSYEDVDALQSAFTAADVSYSVIINAENISIDSSELDLSALPTDKIEEAARELKKLPNLRYVDLNAKSANTEENADNTTETPDSSVVSSGTLIIPSSFSLEQVAILEDACPDAVFDYSFTLYGKTVSTADERIEFENVNIGDDGVNTVFRSIMPYLKRLNYLKLDKCEVSSETMASLRDDFPDTKVVWRVYFSAYGQCGDGTYAVYNTLTDAEKIWATGCVTDHFATELKYCTDVKYLDLGHNCITNIDFVNYMPKLEVAVMSVSWVESLAPLANCPNLEYLEIFSSHVTDITPLADCTNLKHLNISNLPSVKDISCLYNLDLERFFCTMSYIPVEQQEEFKSLHPDCECEFGWVDPSKGRWRFVDGNAYNDNEENYVERYRLLREQFGYDTFDYSK